MTQKKVEVPLANPFWRFTLALGIGMIAMFLLYKYEGATLLERSGGRKVGILVAKAEIAAGERIQPENIEIQEIPIAYVHANALRSEHQSYVLKQKVYRKIPQNSFLQWSDLDDHSEDPTRGTWLARGMRAAAVPLGAMLGRAHILRKGDSVDILFHFNFGEQNSLTVTLFQQVLVIEQEDNFALVALTPEQVELLTFAMAHGAATVVLRNRDDPEQRQLPKISLQGFVERYGTQLPGSRASASTAAGSDKNKIDPSSLPQRKGRK